MIIILVFLLISWCIHIIPFRISSQWKSKIANKKISNETQIYDRVRRQQRRVRHNRKQTKNLPKHDLNNGIKKKKGRQCLPMARRQCKEEKKKRGNIVSGGNT